MDGWNLNNLSSIPPSCFRLIVWEISSCPDVESHKAEDTSDEATAVNFSAAHIERAFVSDLSCGFGRGGGGADG